MRRAARWPAAAQRARACARMGLACRMHRVARSEAGAPRRPVCWRLPAPLPSAFIL
ncbi:hypothetical protein SCE1572_46740 [Sorangium cellulosum So0157-2]|uniref:Uncharacterized protein n=1 Tax=Sorangium cellulosum So0157-2 TaxID=1254432 RepID=S4Y7D5_SORCE|nr:hypothetical protein SCE1572_46740 [Sorangium cellulosum So0157-2]